MASELKYAVVTYIPQVWKDKAYDILAQYPAEVTQETTMAIVRNHNVQWSWMTGRHILDIIYVCPVV